MLLLLTSCGTPKYLPRTDEVGNSPYGAYIIAIAKSTHETKGELIAVDSHFLIILNSRTQHCDSVAIANVVQFKLRYARSNKRPWLVPVYVLSTVFHGYFSIITAPLNLLGTGGVLLRDVKELQYTEQDIDYEQMRLFARFPHGVPVGVAVDSLK
jgi:hypothetical protein